MMGGIFQMSSNTKDTQPSPALLWWCWKTTVHYSHFFRCHKKETNLFCLLSPLLLFRLTFYFLLHCIFLLCILFVSLPPSWVHSSFSFEFVCNCVYNNVKGQAYKFHRGRNILTPLFHLDCTTLDSFLVCLRCTRKVK